MTRFFCRPRKTAAVLGSSAGIVAAGLMMYVAWQHNAQGEVHDQRCVHWLYWVGIGVSWLVVVALPIALATGVGLSVVRWIQGGPPNKPLQPTRAAEPFGQRETARVGPRG